MKRSIAQLIHTLSYGDAISGETLSLKRVFQEAGLKSDIFAINVHPKLKSEARSYKELMDGDYTDVILHYSIGSVLNSVYLGLRNSKRSLIFHNLTPPKWFFGVNPRIVEELERGYDELPLLCQSSELVLADSEFNARELQAFGIKAAVLNLPLDPQRWRDPANPGIVDVLKSRGGVNLLHVGRLAPNKCIEDIIKTFYFLHHHINHNSHLWLVGIDIDTELYSFALNRLVKQFKLEDAVTFAGSPADSEVRAFYEASSAYLCMSEHEGYCVPLLEAMHFGLPVLAFHSSAIPATLDGAGILFKEKRHAELAELINEIQRNSDLRSALVSRGKERVSQLSYESFRDRVHQLYPIAA